MIHPLAKKPSPSYSSPAISSAKLTSGTMSHDVPLFKGRGGIQPLVQTLNRSPTQSPRAGDIFEEPTGPDREMAEENTVIERPVWQSFIVMLMTHFPAMGHEINPAMDIAQVPPKRVVLSADGLSFLNQFILQWYEGGVEIVTIQTWGDETSTMLPTQDVQYSVPYRPVTGLNVIVTPTLQRSLDPREQVILREKEKFGTDQGLNGVGRFLRICIFENLIPPKSAEREARGKTRGPRFERKRGIRTSITRIML